MRSETEMRESSEAVAAAPEHRLFDTAKRLQRHTEGRVAVHVHLSRLRPYNRRRHHLRIAAAAFEPLMTGHEGGLFQLSNDDLVVLCRGVALSRIDDYVLRLRYLFSEDPLLRDEAAGPDGSDPFCDWYQLADDYDEFLAMAEAQLRERLKAEAAQATDQAVPLAVAPALPIDEPRLGAIEEAIAHTDLTALLQRQPICAVAQGATPTPLLHELTISIAGLRHALLPDHDLEANPWLFRDLTRHLDRRMIAMLRQPDAVDLRRSLSLNLNVATLLAPEFLQLDSAVTINRERSVVIELQLIDVFADLASFAFARDFLHDRGYRICLDGATHLSLPFIDRERLGIDLVKLQWSSDLSDYATGERGTALTELVRRSGPERVILSRCDTPAALDVGRRLGITLYQGFQLDHMLGREPRPSDSPQRLAAALQRHRMAERPRR
ncbi:MAG: hypothetical protein ACFCUQ_01360 [Kiloniellales bacterium]